MIQKIKRVIYLLWNLPKALFLWCRFKLASAIISRRNKSMEILTHPHPILSRVADPVDFDKMNLKERTALVRTMGATLASQTSGMKLGLAAPQIGVSLQVAIVQGVVMFNPEWHPAKGQTEDSYEACYSVKNKMFKVERAKYGWAGWTTIDGQKVKNKLKGLSAIVFQHEYDHLNGKCCIDVGEEIINK